LAEQVGNMAQLESGWPEGINYETVRRVRMELLRCYILQLERDWLVWLLLFVPSCDILTGSGVRHDSAILLTSSIQSHTWSSTLMRWQKACSASTRHTQPELAPVPPWVGPAEEDMHAMLATVACWEALATAVPLAQSQTPCLAAAQAEACAPPVSVRR